MKSRAIGRLAMPMTQTFLFMFFCLSSLEFFTEALKCDPLDNVYYHKQLDDCWPCETCPVGYGKITLEESGINLNSENGPSECIKCRPCKEGYFSDKHAYKCKPCMNCTLLGYYEASPCTTKENSICSSQKLDVDRTIAPQERDKKFYRDSTDATKSEVTTNVYRDNTYATKSVSPDTVVFIIIGVFGLFAVVGGIVYKLLRKRQNRSLPPDAEIGLCCSNNRNNSAVSPHQRNSKYKLTNSSSDNCFDDDEKTPLIAKNTKLIQKRKRLLTYPFGQSSTEESDTENYAMDIEEDYPDSRTVRKSYSCIDFKRFVKCSTQNLFCDSESDLAMMKEPHEILKSFYLKNTEKTENIIKKVERWDKKYRWSEKRMRIDTPLPAYDFLIKYARDHHDIIERVKEWEQKEEMLKPALLSQVARYLGPGYRYKCFAREVGLSETDLTNIVHDYKDSVVEQGFQVLQKLKHKELIKSKTDLINLLQKCDLNDVIKKLKGRM